MTEWRTIPSFPRYQISDQGDVLGPRGVLTRLIDACGYYRLGLYRDGKRVNCRIHTLVAEAFIGPRPDGLVVRHLDGNHLNNHPSNLRYGTPSDNVRDSVFHGTQRNIRKTHCPRNHAFDSANTGYGPSGNRICRTCRRDRERSRRAQLKVDAA